MASGNDVDAVAVAPVQVCGISVGVLGDAEGSCGEASTEGSAGDDPAGPGTPGEGSDDPVGSGNDVDLSGTAPVQVCGIAAGVLGDASGGCVAGGSTDPTDPTGPTGPGTDPADPGSGSGDGDVLGDEVVADRTQARAVVQAPAAGRDGRVAVADDPAVPRRAGADGARRADGARSWVRAGLTAGGRLPRAVPATAPPAGGRAARTGTCCST